MTKTQSRRGWAYLAIGFPVMITPIAFLAAIPWLKNQPDQVVYLLAGVAASICVLGSIALAIVKDADADEWHRSAARFSSQWGWLIGGSLIALTLALPPVHNLIISVATAINNGNSVNEQLVLISFMSGFVIAILAQALCTMLISVIWQYRMSRPAN